MVTWLVILPDHAAASTTLNSVPNIFRHPFRSASTSTFPPHHHSQQQSHLRRRAASYLLAVSVERTSPASVPSPGSQHDAIVAIDIVARCHFDVAPRWSVRAFEPAGDIGQSFFQLQVILHAGLLSETTRRKLLFCVRSTRLRKQ